VVALLDTQSKGGNVYENDGQVLAVKKICVRDASKARDFAVPEGCDMVTDSR
jgi:hypothetical protein